MSEATAKAPTTVGALTPMDVSNRSITILEFHDGRMVSHKNDGLTGLKKIHLLTPVIIEGQETFEGKPVSYSCVVLPKLNPGGDTTGEQFRYPTFANDEMTERIRNIAQTRTIQNFSLPGGSPYMPDRLGFNHDNQDYILEFTFELKEE